MRHNRHTKRNTGLALSKSKGFTLIELLVVIAIIGILSSVVLTSLNTARAKARDGRRISDIKQIQLALELYYDNNQTFPADTATLGGTYISTVPNDPTTGNPYPYAALLVSGSCVSYHLGANLETSNTVLNDDVDADAGTACTGSDFSGGYPTCSATSGTPDLCFDVKP